MVEATATTNGTEVSIQVLESFEQLTDLTLYRGNDFRSRLCWAHFRWLMQCRRRCTERCMKCSRSCTSSQPMSLSQSPSIRIHICCLELPSSSNTAALTNTSRSMARRVYRLRKVALQLVTWALLMRKVVASSEDQLHNRVLKTRLPECKVWSMILRP